MTLEDDSALPLDAENFVVELCLFNVSKQLTALGIPTTLMLPGALLRNKKDGGVVRLRYKGKLIELAIEQQNHGMKFAKGTFEKVFASVDTHIRASCDIATPFFYTSDPFWMYQLGKGTLYKLEEIGTLKKGIPSDFRPLTKPEEPPVDFQLFNKTLIFEIPVHRFQIQDFDIIVNETHLMIYGRFENRSLHPGAPKHSREVLFRYRWDRDRIWKQNTL